MSDQANSQFPSSQNSNTPRRVLIVGGVAGGASCAARLRRLDESVEIVDVRSRTLRFVRELRAALLRRQRHRGRAQAAGGVAGNVSRSIQY